MPRLAKKCVAVDCDRRGQRKGQLCKRHFDMAEAVRIEREERDRLRPRITQSDSGYSVAYGSGNGA